MNLERKIYNIDSILVNNIKINKVIIDQHYKKKHSESINDLLILELVKSLDGINELPDSKKDAYTYFATWSD